MDKNLKVLAECVDARSGKRFAVGETFNPAPTVAQAERLVAAGCLPKGAVEAAQKAEDAGSVDQAAIVRDQLNNDGLFDKSDAEIAQIVADEGVQVQSGVDTVTTIAAIRAHRTNPPRPDPRNVVQRTDEGEAAARAADQAATDRYVDKKPGRVQAPK